MRGRGRRASRHPRPERSDRAATRADASAPPLTAPAALVAVFAAVPALGAYLATLHPGVPAGDSGELIAVAATGGVAHPPGYPLWTMLAALWARAIPAGSVAWRLDLFSAVTAAAAAAVIALAVRRATRAWPAALVAAWLWAFSAPAWRNALVAEVFALLGLLAAFTWWLLAPLAANAPARREDAGLTTVALAALGTLALSHHHTLVLLALPAWVVAAVAAVRVGEPPARLAIRSALAGLIGLLPLAWLPIAAARDGALVWGDARSWSGFATLLLRADYGTFRLDPVQAGLAADRSHAAIWLESLPSGFGWPGLVLAALGAAAMAARHRRLAVVVALHAAAIAWFFSRVGFPSDVAWLRGVVERFYVLPAVTLAVVAGLGAATLLARLPAAFRLPAGVALALAALAPPMVRTATLVDQRGNHFAETLARGVLAGLPPRTVLFVQGDLLHNALAVAQRVEGVRPDVVVLDQELMTYDWYVRRVRRAHPDVLPPLGRAQRVRWRDGRTMEGWTIPRGESLDVLVEAGQGRVATHDVVDVRESASESLFQETRAGFGRGGRARSGDDRYSGLPGTRNVLWLDHLAGRRPAAMIGAKDESFALEYELSSLGFFSFAHPRGRPPAPLEQLRATIAVLDTVPIEIYFREQDPHSFERQERWRFSSFVARAALLACQPGADSLLRAHPRARARLHDFARRYEALPGMRDPACLRAIGFLRVFDPAFRDVARARADLERYAASSAEAANDAEVRRTLAGLP